MKVLLIRLGAYGDAVMITPLIRALKNDGHHITLNCSKTTHEILKHDPNVDKFIVIDKKVEIKELYRYWDEIGVNYDKVINLTGSIEERLLKREGTDAFNWAHLKRHIACDINYVEQTLVDGGYEGSNPKTQLFFAPIEHQMAKKWKNKYRDKFTILWSLSGSSYHKTYPYAEYVAIALLNKYPDIIMATVGDEICQLLEWRHPRVGNYSGIWPIRKSFIMTKYVDCVVGNETGVLNAASAFDTPKVILLSHSSEENLTKHWDNVTNLWANVECRPCHKLVFTKNACPLEPGLWSPVCMSQLHSKTVFNAIEREYLKWREKRWGRSIQETELSIPKEKDFLTMQTRPLNIIL